MGIIDRIVEAVVNTDAIQRRIEASYEQGFYDGNDDPVQGDVVRQGYRPISNARLRDFTKMTHRQVLDTVWSLWQSSPLAKRLLVLKRDHLIGRKTTPFTNDEDLTEIINDFWSSNRLDSRASEFTLQLFALGEQIFPAFVREADGRVKIGYIDPRTIEKVYKHPANALEDWIIWEKIEGVIDRYYRIIRVEDDFVDNGTVITPPYVGKLVTHEQAAIRPWEVEFLRERDKTEYDGCVFYFGVNRFSNQTRGFSDLVQVADWIDQADATLWAMGEREQFAGYFAFDVTLHNASPEQVRERANDVKNAPPARGAANFHNDEETWEMWAPDLKQHASIASFIAQVTNITGGMGYPVSWYGYGDDTNRSTLQEQATPSEKTLEHDQSIVSDMLLHMLQFVQDQAEIAGTFTPDEETEIFVDLPEIRSEDIFGIVQSFLPLLQSVLTGRDEGMITEETAARAFHKALAEFGLDIDTEEELAKAEEQEEEEIIEIEQENNEELEERLIRANGDSRGG